MNTRIVKTIIPIAFSLQMAAFALQPTVASIGYRQELARGVDPLPIDTASLRVESRTRADSVSATPLQPGPRIAVTGYTDVRYQVQQANPKPSGVEIRRARIDAKGAITDNWNYRVQVELGGTPKLLDAIIRYKVADYLALSVGQFKVPFSSENLLASNRLETIDRSQVVEALAARGSDVIGSQNGRDIGLQISGSLFATEKRFLIDYAVGGFNGNGINATDNNGAKDFVARVVAHPIPGLDIGGALYEGYDIWGMSPAPARVRRRVGAEIGYQTGILGLRGEYITGSDGSIDRRGGYAQATGFLYEKLLQLVLKYDIYDPDTSSKTTNDTRSNYLIGLNLNFNEWSTLQLNYTHRRIAGESINNDNTAAQVRLAF